MSKRRKTTPWWLTVLSFLFMLWPVTIFLMWRNKRVRDENWQLDHEEWKREQKLEEARGYYSDACHMLNNGLCCREERKEAIELFRKAEAMGLDAAREKLREFERVAVVLHQLQQRAIAGDGEAAYQVAKHYEKGSFAVCPNRESYLKYLQQAAFYGNQKPFEDAARMEEMQEIRSAGWEAYQNGDRLESIKLLEEASQMGDRTAMYLLATIYAELPSENNNKRAREWAHQSARLGYVPAMEYYVFICHKYMHYTSERMWVRMLDAMTDEEYTAGGGSLENRAKMRKERAEFWGK